MTTPRPTALTGALLAGLLLAGCGTAVKEFFGIEEAESAASVIDLGQYHDPLVLLNRANRLFDKRNYLEAALTYERFLELHGLHRQADYAQFRAGLSHLKQFRSIDRDIDPVVKAHKSFHLFLTKYPESLYTAEVRSRLAECRLHLAEADLYVGRFYYRQGTYAAAIARLEGVMKDYGDLPVAEEALYLLGRSYEATGKVDRARQLLEQLLESYPESAYQDRAREQLARLNGHST